MAILFKRKNGFYYVVSGSRGNRKWKSTGERTRGAAQRKLVGFITTTPEPDIVSAPKALSLREFRTQFLKFVAGSFAPGTVKIYTTTLGHFLGHAGNRPLDSIQARDADEFRIERLKKVSPVTVNIELRMVRAAFYTALRWNLVVSNPFKGVRMARIPEQQPAYFSKDDFRKLCSYVPETWLRNIIIVAVMTGMRRGEIINLTWDRVDFIRNVIEVASSETFRTKAGKKRIVPMNETVTNLLKPLHAASKSPYVFTFKGRKVGHSLITHRFKKHVRASGINPKIHFHSLRHTFASWLVQEGVSLYEVQKLMGHSSIAVTQVYSHLQPEQLHGTVNKLRINVN